LIEAPADGHNAGNWVYISVDIPAWRYEFESIVARSETGLQLSAVADFAGATLRHLPHGLGRRARPVEPCGRQPVGAREHQGLRAADDGGRIVES